MNRRVGAHAMSYHVESSEKQLALFLEYRVTTSGASPLVALHSDVGVAGSYGEPFSHLILIY